MDLEAGCVEVLLERVPRYLRSGEYFKALSENGEGNITVPANVLRADLTIASVRDLRHLLESIRFWILTDNRECAEAVVTYMLDCYRDGETLEVSELALEFEITFPYLLIMHTAIQNAETYRHATPSPLILCVLNRHQCSLDILMHISEQYISKSKRERDGERDKDHTLSAFLGKYSIHSVIEEGNASLFKLLYKHHIRSPNLCDTAVKSGSVECLHFLRSRCQRLPPDASTNAAGRSHVTVLKYLHDNGLPLDIYCYRHAANNGQLECLRYLHSIGHQFRLDVSWQAALNGSIDCLKFLHQHGCRWDKITCCAAAWKGHLACLKYAHENGCEWDSLTCQDAAKRGHMDCLQYALEHGCPYASSLAYDAFTVGHNEIGFYILEHCTNLSNDICTFAAQVGRLDILQACVRAGIPWPSDIVATAIRSGHRHCAEFALAHGAPARVL